MITPIEMYTMVPKTQEASHVKQGEQARMNAQQEGAVQSINRQAEQNTQRTVGTNKPENGEFRYDAKEKGGSSYAGEQGNKKKKEEQENKAPTNMSERAGGIDIRI